MLLSSKNALPQTIGGTKTQRASKEFFSADEEDCPEASVMETPILAERIRALAKAFASLDSVNLVDTFYDRPKLMHNCPRGFAKSVVGNFCCYCQR